MLEGMISKILSILDSGLSLAVATQCAWKHSGHIYIAIASKLAG